MEARNAAPKAIAPKEVKRNHTIKIGRPGYKVLYIHTFHYLSSYHPYLQRYMNTYI